jgi:carboxyl-terminal processing protease
MKPRFLLVGALELWTIALLAQPLDHVSIQRLYYTAKVWGYVKYFHSEVAAGRTNLDSQLIMTVRKVIASKSDVEFNAALREMILAPGEMAQPTYDAPILPDSLKYNLDLRWFNDEALSPDVRSALDTIRGRFRPQTHYLVGGASTGDNPSFTQDTSYYGVTTLPQAEVRLLGLCRYWNIINYFAPNKYLIDKNWDTTLTEFVPRFWNASDQYSFYRAILELVSRINDSHGVVFNSYVSSQIFGSYWLPFKLRTIEGEIVVVGVLPGMPGVKPGDVVRSINGVDIKTIRDSVRSYVAASNFSVLERDVDRALIRRVLNGENVRIALEDDTGLREVWVQSGTSYPWYNGLSRPTGPVWRKIQAGGSLGVFGYVDMGRLSVDSVAMMFSDLQNTDGIIFDVRNYPRGTLWTIVDYLYSTPLFNARFTVPDISYPGTLYWITSTIGQGSLSSPYSKEIRILFDEETQSQAEYTVMGLELHRPSLKIGSQTAGADGNVSLIYFPAGASTYFSGLGVFYPDGSQTQRIGIVPDIVARPTIHGIREGRDEVLEVALTHAVSLTYVVQRSTISSDRPTVLQNYPNPFNPTTTIEFAVPADTYVRLEVYNMLGEKVVTLANEFRTAGYYSEQFNATNLASGLYVYRFQAGKFVDTKKLILLR